MILADTSVWVDHLRRGDSNLVALLESAAVLIHPFIVGELACGNLADRSTVIELLKSLPASPVAQVDEVLIVIERHSLHGRGIGYVDVHLLASALLAGDAYLWTRDKRLSTVAAELGVAYFEGGAG